MNIHTTQNLISKVRKQSTDNVTIPEIRSNYLAKSRMQNLYDQPDSFKGNVSFGKKSVNAKDAKKVVNNLKKAVGEIPKESKYTREKGDSIYDRPFINGFLKFVHGNETLTTASIAAVACTARAGTIGILPAKDENTRTNNKYAMSHSLASGIIGFITAFVLTKPFQNSASFVMSSIRKNLKAETLKRLHPQLNIKSIGSDDARKAMDEWKNMDSRKFSDQIKNCAMLPQFKLLGESSEQTFKNILKVDADWASQKGKSFNDVVLKDGSKLYDKVDMSRLGLVVKEDGFDAEQILFKDLDKSYLENLVKDSKNNNWGKLDIKSVYKDGEVVDFRQWKDVDGKQWKLDLDETYVASPYEIKDSYRPRITGEKRFDKKEGVYKFRTFQDNGVDDKLGTKISDDMIKAEDDNEVLFKALAWGPDLLFRIPIATATVALIPWILKNCLGLEKTKKIEPKQQESIKENKIADNSDKQNEKQVAFKGKGGDKPNWIVRKLAEWYGKPLLESPSVAKVTSYLTKLPGRTTQHMSVLGSALTSGMYVHQTLNKDELDPDKRRTLAINQTLGFIVPTIAAYSVNSLINSSVKKKEYKFTGRQQRNIDIAKMEGRLEDAKKMAKELGNKKKGVRILADLMTFTLIYRYAVPVIITPIANKIGDKINAKKAEEKRLAQEQQNQKAEEIKMPEQKELKKAV